MKQNSFSIKIFLQLVFLGLITAAIFNLNFLLDQYALATFKPTPEVAAMIDRLKLTPAAEAMLARAKPQIDDKVAFNKNCQTSESELELGCFVSGRIYVLRIENASLAPEMDVVMAHELLHVAYDRLGEGKKAELGRDLESDYLKLKDSDLEKRMADYAVSEPGQRQNELHSILSTEYFELNSNLDTYYQTYFTDRKVIVEAQKRYEDVFNSRRQALETDLAAIRSLKSQLSALNARMEGLRASGSIAAYNSLVPQQNKLVDSINRRIASYQRAVDEYNALSKSLDSQQITTPTESMVR